MKKEDCVFCKIVAGDLPCHKIFENESHLGFLSIYPNTEGVAVVIPKDHQDSYFAEVPQTILNGLMAAARTTAIMLDKAFDDVGRTGLIFEGFGVDHLHAKLFPMHGTVGEEWQKRTSDVDKFFTHYEGYLSSHDYQRADDAKLAQIAEKIRSVVK